MNIALFTETYLPYINGVVTHVKSLKDGLERAGHNVLVVSADTHTHRHYIKDDVLWCPAKAIKRFYEYGLASPISATRLRLIKKFKPDIIHIHNEYGVGLSGVGIAKILRVPIVYTLHTMYDDYLYYVAPQKLIPVAKKITHRYLRYFGKKASAITGPSQKVQEFLDECGVAKQVSVVPNPVELDKFQLDKVDSEQVALLKKQYLIQDDELVLCFCGRLGKEKSVDVMLNFFANTITAEDKVKLLIIGDGPSRIELEEQAKQLNIDSFVCFTGKVEHDKLVHVYACCQLYITTSLSDTNSISMLEAMATGLPVLHLYDRLNEGQVRTGINGYIFHDADEMRDIIVKYRALPDEKKCILRHSVIESVRKSGQENLANYLLEVYNHINDNPPSRSKRKKNVTVFEVDYYRKKK